MVLDINRFLLEKGTSSRWRNSIQTLFQSNMIMRRLRWLRYSRILVQIIEVRTRSRNLSHFLHFFHIRKSLLSWIKSIGWVFFLIQGFIVHLLKLSFNSTWQLTTTRSILKSESKSRISASICLTEIRIAKSTMCCFKGWIFFILNFRVLSQKISFKLFLITLKSTDIRWKNLIFMISCCILVMLNGLQKSTSSYCHIFVLDRNHLIKINCLSLILYLWLLVVKPYLTSSKWLKMISCA